MKKNHEFLASSHKWKMEKLYPLLFFLFLMVQQCYSQTTVSKYFTGKPHFINTSVGKSMVVDYLRKTTDNDDSVKSNSIFGMVDLSSMINKAMYDPTGEYKDYQVLDATKFGIIGYYHQEYTLFYCDISDAVDLNNKKISFTDYVMRIQLLSLPDYVPPATLKEKKTFMDMLKMDHAYYSFPMRLNIMIPFSVSGDLDQNFGFELSNVWSRPKSVVNFKFQVSLIWLMHKETEIYERFIIPSYNMGISFNFLGDLRFNLKPYVTVGWNPVYYYFKSDNDLTTSPENLNNGWYLNTGALNYGIDLEGWVKKGLGFSISLEQSRYLGELMPDIYGSAQAVALNYLTFKIGLLF
jgi:hypothetical protein